MTTKHEESHDSEANEILNLLSALFRSSQLYDFNNATVRKNIEKLLQIVNPLLEETTTVDIEILNDFFYFNKNRLKYNIRFLTINEYLLNELKRRKIGAISFQHTATENDIILLLDAFNKSIGYDDPFNYIVELLSKTKNIVVEGLKINQQQEVQFDSRKLVKKTYYNAVSLTKGVMNKIKMGEKVSLKKAKRVIESIVDKLIEEESLLIGMTVIKDYDDYTYHHSVNVSILSMALGYKIGLDRKTIADLGLAALFHDIGKINVPGEILNKPTKFTDEEFAIVKQHPAWGVKAILKIKGLNPNSIRSAIVSFEHHLQYNLGGYPTLRLKNLNLDLFSKIVTLADQYDAMTSSRVYSRIPIPPDKALMIMTKRIGTELDPHLTKIFINMVGSYPIGSLVLLNTKEMGFVVESNPTYSEKPRVLIVLNSNRERVYQKVDLMERDDKGAFLRRIVKTLDPNKYQISLAEYFIDL
jgi:HD-GYP domain-containing protein (c-di-GMP phosphodiesterase class II)